MSGQITSPGGQALSGVTLTLTGSQNQTTTSGSDGHYSFTVNTLGQYTVQASQAGYNFTPTSVNIGGFSVPQTVNFQATLGAATPPSLPSGTFFSQTINYKHKPTGALAGIGTNLLGGASTRDDNVIEGMNYTAFGAAKQVFYGNNRQATLSYDLNLMRLTQMIVARPDGANTIVNNTYTYSENGLLSYISNGTDNAYNARYEYNYRNQLKEAYTNGLRTNYYQDHWGNLAGSSASNYNNTTFNHASRAGSVPTTNRLSSMTANGNTTNFSYDSAGNMTAAGSTTYEWDAANRLKNVNGGALGSYGYDGNGKRVKKSESGTTTYYVLSSVLGSAMEVTAAGVQRAYVMNGGSVVAQLNPNGQFYWLHLDHLGSGRKMTDSRQEQGTKTTLPPPKPPSCLLFDRLKTATKQRKHNSG